MSRVAVKRSAEVKEGIGDALDLLANFTDLSQGKYVAIKPNDTWASPDDTIACPQAESVASVIQYAKLNTI
jgi:uncharacterized protein (DUF362 family)